MLSLFLLVVAYLMGSICSAIVVCHLCSLPDPREEGSKNPGATNVLRIAGKGYSALVLLTDILKGTIPVALANALGVSPTVVGLVALAAVLGHMYPIFFQFKGGKGVATAIGAMLGLHFMLGVVVIITWLLVARFSLCASLASLAAVCLAPVYALMMTGEVGQSLPLFFIALMVAYKHNQNITRLMDGKEPKIHLKGPLLDEIMEATPVEVKPVNKETKKKAGSGTDSPTDA